MGRLEMDSEFDNVNSNTVQTASLLQTQELSHERLHLLESEEADSRRKVLQ